MAPPTVWLRPNKALPSINRHPWVFVGSVGRIDGMPAPGAAVRLVTVEGKFVAWGLFNPESAIRVRLYSWKEDEPLTDEFFAGRVARAIASRVRLFGDGPELRACRLISSEGDSLSGLTVDRYGDFLLLQWTSLALFQREAIIAAELERLLKPAGIWRR